MRFQDPLRISCLMQGIDFARTRPRPPTQSPTFRDDALSVRTPFPHPERPHRVPARVRRCHPPSKPTPRARVEPSRPLAAPARARQTRPPLVLCFSRSPAPRFLSLSLSSLDACRIQDMFGGVWGAGWTRHHQFDVVLSLLPNRTD